MPSPPRIHLWILAVALVGCGDAGSDGGGDGGSGGQASGGAGSGAAGQPGSAGTTGGGRGGSSGVAGAGVAGRGGTPGTAGSAAGAPGTGGGTAGTGGANVAGAGGNGRGGAGGGAGSAAAGRGGGTAGTGGANVAGAGGNGRGGGSAGSAAGGRGGGIAGSGGGTAGSSARGGAGGSAGSGAGGSAGSGAGGGAVAGRGGSGSYDQAILADGPVAYWAMSKLTGSEPDLTGNNHTGTYHSGTTKTATMPNSDQAADFNGSSQYVSVPSSAAFSIPTTGEMTWEGWIRPDVLQFPNASGDEYVDWMGKCQDYGPTCEWEARMYSTDTPEDRCNRMSAYVFNPSAGLGSAGDWQPVCGLIQAGNWYHVVGAYTTKATPSNCNNATTYPGGIDIWVNGVKWSHANHGQTGCMSQYNVIPKANNSPLNIGSMSMDTFFPGAIGKVAIYDKLLTQTQINNHYRAMTGNAPTGSCGNSCNF